MTAGCEERWILHSWGEPMTLVPYLVQVHRVEGLKPLVRLRLPFLGIYVAIALSGPGLAGEPSLLPSRRSIVYILADDLGYGDVRCFNRDGKIATPHLDRLAGAGDAVHGRSFRLGGVHAHALRDPDRAIRLAIVAQVGRALWLLSRV